MTEGATNTEDQVAQMLPKLSGGDLKTAEQLPDTFLIDVPYFSQTDRHYCGAACIQMLQSYYGHPVLSQEHISYYAGWRNWRLINHESFSEDFDRFCARINLLPATYYPGAFILPEFATGPEGGDFILTNRERVSEIDFAFFKTLLLSINGPVFYRIHFTTDEYPMDEDMAQRLDNSGHCLLMVGWNKRGFLFHDPWDVALWGGKRGGPAVEIPYETLIRARPLVNCCKEGSHGVIPSL